MTKISAMIVADSVNEFGDRITTMELVFPRFILAELNTHRMFSRNSASSRAIPFKKMVEMVEQDPFIPMAWQKTHKGMQGSEYLDDKASQIARSAWLMAKYHAVSMATNLDATGASKQLCNRLLEPFMWHKVLLTATGFQNFFDLRCPSYELETPITKTKKVFRSRKDVINSRSAFWDLDGRKNFDSYSEIDWLKLNTGQAEIHMMALAEAMYDAMSDSTPKFLKGGEWHTPYQDKINISLWAEDEQINIPYSQKGSAELQVSTGMAARISYTSVGEMKEPSYETLIDIHDKMKKAVPFHASPFEHCARAMTSEEREQYTRTGPNSVEKGWCKNYRGFIQYREIIEKEQVC